MSKSDRELFRAAAFVIIRDEAGRVLLQRRANTGYLDGHYDFPSGHVDAGESFLEAVVRELNEETGLRVAADDLVLKHINQNYTDFPYINAVFEARSWAGDPKITEPDKCDDMRFFSLEALPTKSSLAVRYMERAGFDADGVTMSYVSKDDFEKMVGVKLSD